MRFHSAPIAGVVEASTEWREEERGSFGRILCNRALHVGDHCLNE